MNRLKDLKLKDVIAIALIIFSTYIYFALKVIPEDFDTINLYFFEIGSFAFSDIAQLVYYLKMKILILSFTLIWYFTCKHWWKSAILVIIAIELSKVISSLNSKATVLDEIDYIISLPITLPIILILILISRRLNVYNLSMELHATIDNEIDTVFNELIGEKNDNLKQLNQDYNEVKMSKSNVNTKMYLKKLIAIRNKYYKT